MHLLTLKIHNFGVFRGQHQLDLEPQRQPDGTRRHLTVISGHNGAGKSTLFQAIRLALHGSLALGNRVSQQDYGDFLRSRLHRYEAGDTVLTSEEGGVELSFRFVQSGRPLRIRVKRTWHRNGESVRENLNVSRDGERLDIAQEDYQIWLNDMVPSGLAPLCFFDAERLDALADPEQHSDLLSDTLRGLLGLDLVGRLQSDLTYYARRHGKGRDVDQLREEVLEQQADLDDIEAQLHQFRTVATDALNSEQADLEAELARQERCLAAEGGRYANRRPALKDRLTAVEDELEQVTEQLNRLCGGLLPFALAPKLCKSLDHRLTEEAEIVRLRAARKLWRQQVHHLEAVLEGDELWEEIPVPPETRHHLVKRLTTTLNERGVPYGADEKPLVHHLAKPERQQLKTWITQALYSVPERVQALGERLQQLQAERQRIKDDLERAPDNEVLAPIHNEIMRLEAALADLRERRLSLSEKIGALQFQREEQERQLDQAIERLKDAQAHERQLALTERSKVALRAYEDALTRQRLGMLEEKLVGAFNAICRKEHLLTDVHIDPNDFGVELHTTSGHKLELSDFPAGERQLYALALLRALRQVSRRQLPLAVDTPLARLDEEHRHRLISEYVPEVSEQVLLFATDAELNGGLLAQAQPFLARVYLLDYDSEQQETLVERMQYGP